MQLYCMDGVVVATHDDWQSIPADAYPGATRRVVPNDTLLEKIGEPPPDSLIDMRPYAEPKLKDAPSLYPLSRFQFEALLIAQGLSMEKIEEAIAALGLDDFARAVAISRLRNATSYNRTHPLVEQVRAALKMKPADLDRAWMTAKDMK